MCIRDRLTELLVENSLVHYLCVTLLSVMAGYLIAFIRSLFSCRSDQKKREIKIAEICELLEMEEQTAQNAAGEVSGPSLWEVPAEQEEKLVDEMPLKDMPIDKLPTEDIPTEEIPKASRTAAESIDANRLSRDAAARKAQETPIDQNPSHKLPAVREGLRAWIELCLLYTSDAADD